MKSKILLLAIFVLSFGIAQASAGPDPDPTCTKGKKDDLVGVVFQSESKKPIKDVSVTAYLISHKEKSVITDDDGTYAFNELRPGTYKFVFEKAGFKKVTKEKVVVKTDEAFQLNIEMIETKGFDLLPSPLHFTDF